MILELNRERGYTFVVIEHDMDFIASLCERVIVLSQGAVLTDGPMEQVRRDPRVLDAYLGGDDVGGAGTGPAVAAGEGLAGPPRAGPGRSLTLSGAGRGAGVEGNRGEAAAPILALECVTGGYGGAEIIHEVSVSVGPGEIVVLIGPNGAGKSTVMNAVLGRLELAGGAGVASRPGHHRHRARTGWCARGCATSPRAPTSSLTSA